MVTGGVVVICRRAGSSVLDMRKMIRIKSKVAKRWRSLLFGGVGDQIIVNDISLDNFWNKAGSAVCPFRKMVVWGVVKLGERGAT